MAAATFLMAAIAALLDARTGRIPNWLSIPPIFLAPALFLVFGGPMALFHSLAGIFLVGLVPYLLFRLNAAGGGDCKLFAAIGAMGGMHFGIEAQFLAFTITAAYSVGLLVLQGRVRHLIGNLAMLVRNAAIKVFKLNDVRGSRRQLHVIASEEALTPVRLGVPIFLGVTIALWLNFSSMVAI